MMHEEETAVLDDTTFPSGPWLGYYLYGDARERHRMDLDLRFRDGLVDGTGIDDIAPFTIRGHYDRDSLIVTWHKTYASHDVWYRGFREGRGIWGTWELPSARGGFMIWPKGIGESGVEHAEAADDAPVDAVVAGSPGATLLDRRPSPQ